MNCLLEYGNCGLGDLVSSTMYFRDWSESRGDGDRLFLHFTSPFLSTRYSCVFDNNPNVTLVERPADVQFDRKASFSWGSHNRYESDITMDSSRGRMCDNIYETLKDEEGFSAVRNRRWNDIWLSERERQLRIETDLPVCIVNCGYHPFYTNARNWGFARFQEVVDALRGRVLFIQVGETANGFVHRHLKGAYDLVDASPIRYVFTLLNKADFVLCTNSSLFHMAAIPAESGSRRDVICVLGGRDPWRWTDCYDIPNVKFHFVRNNERFSGCSESGHYCCNCALTEPNPYSNDSRICKRPVREPRLSDHTMCECFRDIGADEVLAEFEPRLKELGV